MKWFDDEPDFLLEADAGGIVSLGRDPFTVPGQYPLPTIIVRVEHEGRVGYGFLEQWAFNLAFWRGDEDVALHELAVRLLPE